MRASPLLPDASTAPLVELVTQLLPRGVSTVPHRVPLLPGLGVLAYPERTRFESFLYEPLICLILQGAKETAFGEQTLRMKAGECSLVSHDLPVRSRITQAPYMALILDLSVETLRGLYDEVGDAVFDGDGAEALAVHKVDAKLLDALFRYVALAAFPLDAKVLGPGLVREVHFRLLTAPIGAMLRRLLRHDSHASAIKRAIARLRADFRSAVEVPSLAREVGMSVSGFHKHFKAITRVSPLQFQKDLRLLEARRLLATEGASVSTTAYEVGYESPSQFSREYSRKFGVPPRDTLAHAHETRA